MISDVRPSLWSSKDPCCHSANKSHVPLILEHVHDLLEYKHLLGKSCLNQSSINDFETEWYSKSAGSGRTRSRSVPVTTYLESRNRLRSGGWQKSQTLLLLEKNPWRPVHQTCQGLRKANAAPFGSGKEMQSTSFDESQPRLWEVGSRPCFAQRLTDQDLEAAESRFEP